MANEFLDAKGLNEYHKGISEKFINVGKDNAVAIGSNTANYKAFKVFPQGDQKLAIVDNKIKIGIRNAEMEIVDGASDEELKTQLGNLKTIVDANPNEIYYSLVVRSASYHKGTISSVDVDNCEIIVNDGPTTGNFIQVNLKDNNDRNSKPKVDDPENFNVYNNFIVEGYPDLGTIDIGFNTFTAGINSSAVNNSSVAMGKNARALGKFTAAFGEDTIAGHRAFVAGGLCEALGQESFAAGLSSKASGSQSVAIGDRCISSGSSGVALGRSAKATSDYAVALGYTATAKSASSVAIGDNVKATAAHAVAIGHQNTSQHENAVLVGHNLTSSTNDQIILGSYNVSNKNSLLIIGNGDVTGKSNALELSTEGNLKISGSLTSNNVNLSGNLTFDSEGCIGKGIKKSGYFMGSNCLVNTVILCPTDNTYCNITQTDAKYNYSWKIWSPAKLSLIPALIIQKGKDAPTVVEADKNLISESTNSYEYLISAELDFDVKDDVYNIGLTYLSLNVTMFNSIKFKAIDSDEEHPAEHLQLAQPYHGIAIGNGAAAIGHISTAIGYGAKSVGSKSIVIGNDSIAANSDEVVIGYRNAFTVNSDGTATIKTAPKKEMDVVNKKYVDDLIKSALSSNY